MQVLILEDDPEKAQRIRSILSGLDGARIQCNLVSSVARAREQLDSGDVDLLILDIRVPFRDGEAPSDDGGIQLLRELLEDDRYRRPKYVVGISGVESLFAETSKIFQRHGWSLLRYSPTNPEWADSLRFFVRHVLQAGDGESAEAPADIVIITALEDPEFKAVKQVFPELEGPRPLDARTLIWEGDVFVNDKPIRIVAAPCWQMGLTACAVLAEKLLQKFKPSVLAMTGICAGYKDTVSLGDVLVATQSWEWQGGKIVVAENGGSELSPAPESYRADQALITKLKVMQADSSKLTELTERYFRQDIDKRWAVRYGPMVSGLSVVGAATTMHEVRAQHRKVAGLEMEAYAIYAASHFSVPGAAAIVMKGVCDYGDENKNNEFQYSGSVRSALLLRGLIEQA